MWHRNKFQILEDNPTSGLPKPHVSSTIFLPPFPSCRWTHWSISPFLDSLALFSAFPADMFPSLWSSLLSDFLLSYIFSRVWAFTFLLLEFFSPVMSNLIPLTLLFWNYLNFEVGLSTKILDKNLLELRQFLNLLIILPVPPIKCCSYFFNVSQCSTCTRTALFKGEVVENIELTINKGSNIFVQDCRRKTIW